MWQLSVKLQGIFAYVDQPECDCAFPLASSKRGGASVFNSFIWKLRCCGRRDAFSPTDAREEPECNHISAPNDTSPVISSHSCHRTCYSQGFRCHFTTTLAKI